MEKNTSEKIKSGRSKSDENTLDGVFSSIILEEAGSVVVFSFGRFNPITAGHEKLVNKLKSVASKARADLKLYLSHSQDAKKNPIPYDEKIALAKSAFGNVVQKSKARTIIEILKELNGKYNTVVMVAGGDRIKEFEKLLQKYNGKDYNFNNIRVVSAGTRDPDADDVSGMSASKLRAAAAAGDFELFKKGLPTKIQKDAKTVYDMVRDKMGIKEEYQWEIRFDEELQEVLNMQQRMKRKMMMKRIKSKIKIGKRKARNRIASKEKLELRAKKQARNLIRKRFLGDKSYAEIPVGGKIQVDRKLEKKKAAISRVAKKLIPKMRKAEMERISSLRNKKKNESTEFKQNIIKFDNEIKVLENYEFFDLVESILNVIKREQLISESVRKNLEKKSNKCGYSFRILEEVFIRGLEDYATNETTNLTENQYAFGRVNSFISGGKALDEDFDLLEGVNDPAIFKVIFMAGGPGSGKTFYSGKTGLPAIGFRPVNSDRAYEVALTKAGLSKSPEDIFSEKGQALRIKAKAVTGKMMKNYLDGRLGIVVDGTGREVDRIAKYKDQFEKMGYETAMLLVNTDLETAIDRDIARGKKGERTLGKKEVTKMWKNVQRNIGSFQTMFKDKFFVVDNNTDSDLEKNSTRVYKKIKAWALQPPRDPIAQKWIQSKKKALTEATKIPHSLKQIEDDVFKALSPLKMKEIMPSKILSQMKRIQDKYLFELSAQYGEVGPGHMSLSGYFDGEVDYEWEMEDGGTMPIELEFFFYEKKDRIILDQKTLKNTAHDIADTIYHEWMHLQQARNRNWKNIGQGQSPKKRYIYKVPDKRIQADYATDDEIEAHAKSIADVAYRHFGSIEAVIDFLRRPKTKVIPDPNFDIYLTKFGSAGNPVLKRLFKKIVFFVKRKQ
jgi:nicotinic acid mononucleotide adenylyltransferase